MFREQAIISKWIADMYDLNVTETDDVEFALSVIGSEPKRILEIACGSGRILVPLAKAGHNLRSPVQCIASHINNNCKASIIKKEG